MRSAWSFRLALLAAVSLVHPAHGQTSDPDSTSTDTGGGLSDIGRLAQDAAESDSTAALLAAAMADSTAGFTWLSSLKPTLTVDVTANVQQITRNARLSAIAVLLDGATSTTSLRFDDRDFRQQDRDSQQRNFDTSLSRELGTWAKLDFRFANATSEDRSTFTNGIESIIESDQSNGTFDLKGTPLQVSAFQHVWAVSGDISDAQGSNRGTNNDRALASGGATSRWKFQSERVQAEAKFGYDRGQGDLGLRGLTSEATTTQDTVGAALSISEGDKITFRTTVDRFSFAEERLDFRRNSSGVIDTLTVPESDRVGREREMRATDRVSVNATSRPWSRLSLVTGLQHSLGETRYRFSQQGLEIRDETNLNANMTFRYAQAGSLSVKYTRGDLWDDRKTRGSTTFRGKETRLNQDVALEVDQRFMTATNLKMSLSQRLTQNIFEDDNNQNDRDQLYDRFDASVTSDAIEDLRLTVAGTWGATSLVNVDAERVGNNKDDRLFEARGGYTFKPWRGFSLMQDYRMQIVFIDFHNSNDRDQFNKQGVLVTETTYDFERGPSFKLRYSVDFRRNGTRDPSVEGVKYRTDLRRYDHRLLASIRIPWKGLSLVVDTTRGFLRDENPQAVNPRFAKSSEDRGEIHVRINGSRRIFSKATLRVDVERVLNYGPRVRPENEDYWVANSGLVVNF